MTRSSKLVPKALPLLALTNARHADAKGLQHASDMAFQILAETDQAFTCTNKAAQPIRFFAADVNRSEPIRPRKLRETFRIGAIRFVQPRRQALVGLTGVNADRGQTELYHSTL